MRFFLLVVVLCSCAVLSAQYSAVGLNEKAIARIAANSKNAPLYIVIENEKDPSDAALINAVKKYWKVGSYKYLSRAEYLEQGKKKSLLLNTFYLYESYEDYALQEGNGLEVITQRKFHSGVYTLMFNAAREPDPKQKNKDAEPEKNDPVRLNFDMRPANTTSKDKVVDGYFDLMVKYFNNEIHFCQTVSSVKDVKKEDKDGIVYFHNGLTEVQNKDILLTKEQVTRLQPKDKKEGKKVPATDAVAQFNAPKNVFTVYPEDIKLALSKADPKVLIYSNDMLLLADGSVMAAPNNYNEIEEKSDHFLWMALGVLGLAFGAATLMK